MHTRPRATTLALALIAASLMVASPVLSAHNASIVAAPATSGNAPAVSTSAANPSLLAASSLGHPSATIEAEIQANLPTHYTRNAPASLRSAAPTSPVTSTHSTGSVNPASAKQMLAAASASLEAGSGPAAGRAWSCSTPSADALSCSVPAATSAGADLRSSAGSHSEATTARADRSPSSAITPSYSTVPTWYNQTNTLNLYSGYEPQVYNASAAYDPYMEQVVLFGGCDIFGNCPTNATWIYNGDFWINETDFIQGYVPAAYGAGLVWDQAYGFLFMVGGIDAAYDATNWTWLYDGFGWFNVTLDLGYAGAVLNSDLNGTAFAALAYDNEFGVAVLVDGCLTWDCSNVYDSYWVLGDYGWVYEGVIEGLGEWSWMWGQTMAYDDNDQELVLFGGESYYTGDGAGSAPVNETLVFNGTWENDTTASIGCILFFTELCYYPAARAFASETWDGQLGVVVLTGGDGPYGLVNDTWYFDYGAWYPSDSIFGTVPTPGIVAAAMPTNSTDIAPIEIGGLCYGLCLNTSYVFEAPPSIYFNHVTPSPTEVGIDVNVSVSNGAGDGSGPNWTVYVEDTEGNHGFQFLTGLNFSTEAFTVDRTFAEPTAESVNIFAYAYDFFDIASEVETTLTVNATLAATAVATPTATELGHAIDFTATGADGVPPISFLWGFGDGTADSTSASVDHTYATTGHFDAWANVSDTLTFTNLSVPVTVYPDLVTTAAASTTATDLGIPVTFTATPTKGSGDYTNYAWTFTGAGTGSGASDAYTCPTAGTCTGTVVVTDSLGFTATASASVTINPDPTGTLTASASSVHTGTTVTFTATPSGGTGAYTYAWTAPSALDCTASTTDKLTCSAPTTGSYPVSVTMTDAVGKSVTQSVTESVTTPSTTTSFLTSDTGLALIGVVAVIVIAAIALLAMRRRKKPAPAPLTPADPATGATGGAGAPPTTGTPPAGPPPGAS